MSLNGEIKKINGVLPILIAAKELGYKHFIIPQDNYFEASFISGITVNTVSNLEELVNAYKEDGQAAPIEKVMTVTAKIGLNVRTGPSTDYSIITALPCGAKVTVYEEREGWARIGDGQWVCAQYLN